MGRVPGAKEAGSKGGREQGRKSNFQPREEKTAPGMIQPGTSGRSQCGTPGPAPVGRGGREVSGKRLGLRLLLDFPALSVGATDSTSLSLGVLLWDRRVTVPPASKAVVNEMTRGRHPA